VVDQGDNPAMPGWMAMDRMRCESKIRGLGREQAGMTIIEVLVAAIIVVAVSLGALGAIDAATHSTGQERNRAAADGVAQADQARLRSFRISDLANLNQTRTVIEDGMTYTVVSRGAFVTDSTGTASCDQGTASADYIKTTSTVTWPNMGTRPAVVAESIISPPNGAVASDHGALAIEVDDAQNNGIPNVPVSGSGADSFSGTTGSTGCAIFGDLQAGDYTLSVSGIATGLVDHDGNPPTSHPTSVIAQSTNTVVLQYANPGSIPVSFTTRTNGNGSLIASKADSIMVFNTGMTAATQFGTAGTQATTITATPLFPFSSPDAVYAGLCEADNPNPNDVSPAPVPQAIASVTVPAGGSSPATIQLPALVISVRSGTSSLSQGSLVSGATVTIADDNCPDSPTTGYERVMTTNTSGTLANPGLPYSVYDVCVGNSTRHKTVTNVSVQNVTSGTTLSTFYLGSSVGTNGWVSGVCPT
jgi:Tfp pilus assembly protein PilV